MTTYTGTADVNGNFTINIGSALTSGEIVQVTAQKDGQSKSINIQAPSEPYLPPTENNEEISAGFVIDFPPKKSIYRDMLEYPDELLYTSNQLEVSGPLNLKTITNKIMPSGNSAIAYIAFRIPIADILSASQPFFGMRQGYYDAATDTLTFNNSGVSEIGLEVFKNPEIGYASFGIDDKYIYYIFSNDYRYTPETNSFTDGVYNYAYKVVYGSQEYIARFKFGHPE